MGHFFKKVLICKPRSSRDSSIESFIVCKDYCPPQNYTPSMMNPLLDYQYDETHQMTGINRCIAPFMACGDVEFDSDACYPIPEGYTLLDVLQPPINPPYKTAIEEMKH